jgi:hypothetical protein
MVNEWVALFLKTTLMGAANFGAQDRAQKSGVLPLG